MPKAQQQRANRRIIPTPSHLVKARIIAAGLTMTQLAKAASISRPNLSHTLNGQRADRRTQLTIWDAFRRLTGSEMPLEEFWGELLSERMVG